MSSLQHNNRSSASPASNRGLVGGLLLCLLFFAFPAMAKEWRVAPGNGTLQSAIDTARSGDTLLLAVGTYTGSVNIHRSLILSGHGVNGNAGGSIIDGEGSSHVITVSAPDVIIRGLKIEHSGDVAEDENSGVFITDKGDRTRIESNHLEHNLIGVYLKGPETVVVHNNVIIGSEFYRMNDRGNGVYLWNTPGSIISDNVIRYGRDGIFVNGSRNNIFSGNHMSELRFAVHYMYAHDSEISNNISINNHVGFAIMFSDRIIAKNNISSNDRTTRVYFSTPRIIRK